MDITTINSYIEILTEELIPALGCTEPIAIAYAAAKARELLGCFPEHAVLECSGNIIKNVMSVRVPNCEELTGIKASMLAGLVGGKAEKQLEVLSEINSEHIAAVKKLLANDFCEVKLLSTDANLHLLLKLTAGNEYITVEIKNAHTNLYRIEKNGQVVFQQNENDDKYLGSFTDRRILSVKGIYEFANSVPLERIRDLIAKQIDCNMRIAEAGLQGDYGVNIGQIMLAGECGQSVSTKIRAYAAAASEARMSGCVLPVVTNSGSGNQGIAASIPVIIYARENGLSEEKLYRGLVFSNLLTIHQKTLIGRLSAFCGAISASCASGAAITYLKGGSLAQINKTIINMLANVSGIVCDGAKPSCAAKIASCLDAAYISHLLAMEGKQYQHGSGIVKEDVECTISAIGRIAHDGMRATDAEILKIMLEA